MQKTIIDYEKVYHSKECGDYVILYEEPMKDGWRQVRILFINTLRERSVKLCHALSGEIRDLYKRTVFSIGYMGDYDAKDPYYKLLYSIWGSMMNRCYSNNICSIGYASIGVKVSDRWLCFANFQKDAKLLYNYNKLINNPSNYQLDKDYLQQHIPKCNRIYSNKTCIFLSSIDNNNLHAIENNLLYRDKMSSKYIGVSRSKNKCESYEAVIRLNKKKYRIGTFSNEIAAANAYNYYFDKYINYELVRIHNDVPYMPPEEFSKYYKQIKEIIKIVK